MDLLYWTKSDTCLHWFPAAAFVEFISTDFSHVKSTELSGILGLKTNIVVIKEQCFASTILQFNISKYNIRHNELGVELYI